MICPQGNFKLDRYPSQKNQSLQAWDSADLYLLQYIAENFQFDNQPSLLILNDSFGAISLALSGHAPFIQSDSWLSQQGIQQNFIKNDISTEQLDIYNSLDTPDKSLDIVLIKVPRSLSLLEDQLFRIRPLLNRKTTIIASGMVKNIHTSTIQLFEKIIGPTHTTLAQKKSRLIISEYDPDILPGDNPYPTQYKLDGSDILLTNHANVFSREKLDIGSRFLLEHMPETSGKLKIIDLGCGNGVIGIAAAKSNPDAQLTFIDESWMAIESARINFNSAFQERKATFIFGNSLENITENSIDLILINPPFHQHNTMGDSVAWQMLRESKKVLKQGGEIRIIGNRHLNHHLKLKQLFGNYINIASNKKFAIIKAVKR